jgi:hypothetical protein
MVRFPIWAGVLVLGLALSFTSALAFIAPTTSPGVGGGSLQLDASGNIGVGTASSTPVGTFNSTSTESGSGAHGRIFMVASSTNPGIGLKNLTPTTGNTFIWSSRDFGNLQLYRESQTFPGLVVIDINPFGDVAIGQKATSTGAPYKLSVGGAVNASSYQGVFSSSIRADNIIGPYAFGNNYGVYNYAFPASLAIGTTTVSGLPTNGLLVTGTTTLATIAGNVGIGTTNPGAKLDVINSAAGPIARLQGGSDDTNYEYVGYYSGAMRQGIMLWNGAWVGCSNVADEFCLKAEDGNRLSLYTTGAVGDDILLMPGSGNVGIGTTTPTSAHIQELSSGVQNLQLEETGAGAAAQIILKNTVRTWELGADASPDGFYIHQPGGAQDNFFITPTGNVGIGTTTPAYPLSVNGEATFYNNLVHGVATPVANSDAANKSYVDSAIGGSGNGSFSTLSVSGTSTFATTNGDVGIGTATPAYKLDISAGNVDGVRVVSSNSPSIRLDAAGGMNWALATKYSASNLFEILYGNGVAPSTSYFSINTSGNVGIGTTTPQSTLNLWKTSGNVDIRMDSGTNSWRLVNVGTDNTFRVQYNLTNNLAITSAGNVGIGTTTPGSPLQIMGQTRIDWGTQGRLTLVASNDSNLWNIDNSSGQLRIFREDYVSSGVGPNGLIKMSIANDGTTYIAGNVGVGTTTPSYKLHVEGTGYFSQPLIVGTPTQTNHAATKSYVDSAVLTATSSQYWTLSGSNLFPNNTSYNVGIGTTTPAKKLDIYSSSYNNFLRLTRSGNTVGGSVGDVDFAGENASSSVVNYARIGGFNNSNTTGAENGSMQFYTMEAGILTEQLRITNSGNVGIGTSTPQDKLDVAGAILTSAPLVAHQTSKGVFEYNSGKVAIRAYGATAGTGYIVFNTGGGGGSADSEKVRITSAGNVGIGTTTPVGKFTVSTGGSWNLVNTYPFQFINLDGAGNEGNGLLVMGGSLSPSSNIFTVQDYNGVVKLTVDGTGRVAIGTSTPNYVLDVVGTAEFSQPVIVGTPTATNHATTKSYVDSIISGSSGVWKQSSTSLYPSSTTWNVGIGTAIPNNYYNITGVYQIGGINSDDRWLTIAGSTTTIPSVLNLENTINTDGGTIGGIIWTRTGGQIDAHLNVAGIVGVQKGIGTTAGSEIQFWTKGSGGPASNMVINNSGNVGIGTTTPANKLSILGGNISIQPGQVIGSGSTFDSPISAASSSIELYGPSTGDLTIRTGYTNGDILLLPRQYVGIGTTTPSYKLHVEGTGYFSQPLIVGTPTATNHATTKSYVDSAVAAGTSTNAKACNGDATCEMTSADLGGGNITGVGKLTVTTIDPLYQINGKKYSTYASAIAGGVKEEYVGKEKMKKITTGKWGMEIDFDQLKDGSDLWVWRHAIDFSADNVEVLVTPIGVPVPVAYEIKGNKIIFSSESTNHKLQTINFSYRLIGKRLDWAEWPTFAKDQSEKPSFLYENYIKGYLVK